MKKIQIHLIVAAIFLFTGLGNFQNASGAVRSPLLYAYSIAGKDHQGVYKGTAKIILEPNSRKSDILYYGDKSDFRPWRHL